MSLVEDCFLDFILKVFILDNMKIQEIKQYFIEKKHQKHFKNWDKTNTLSKSH